MIQMRKAIHLTLSVLAVVLAVSLMFTIPSGAITEEAQSRYSDAMWNEEEGGIAIHKPIAVVAKAVFSDILPAANVDGLDIDLFTPGSTPIAENFTENGYRDETIIVEMETLRMYDSDVFVAYVKIATPSQIRTAIAGNKLSSGRTNLVSVISQNYNGIVGINGDYYPKTKGGYIVRMGQTYREKTSDNLDLLLIDEMGDLHILPHGKANQKDALEVFHSEHTIVNGFFFGPGLVIDGVKQEIPREYEFDPNSKNPRAGIAQLGPLTYALVVVNGRSNASEGVTMAEFADIMMEIGAVQAYNLDGGNSATLAFNGKVFNDKPQGERDVSDIIYFASATEEE